MRFASPARRVRVRAHALLGAFRKLVPDLLCHLVLGESLARPDGETFF